MISALAAFLAAVLLTWLMLIYALKISLMDVPNARSSHLIPTPRGGGIAIVLTFLAMCAWMWWSDHLSRAVFLSMSIGGGAVALVGFLDDHGHINARWRLLVHFGAASTAIFCLGGLPPLVFFGTEFSLGMVGNILGVFFIVWMLNLYNFMDGIDGIAGVEAISAAGGMAYLIFSLGMPNENWMWPLFLAISTLGFLVWNFPPARIFMGDAGSGFIGYTLATMVVASAWLTPALFWGWSIMLAVFIIDATTTLLRRLLSGEKVYEAHRTHAYQHASQRFGRHRPITVAVALINIFWLFPFAYLATTGIMDGATATAISYLPLTALALYFGAGKKNYSPAGKRASGAT